MTFVFNNVSEKNIILYQLKVVWGISLREIMCKLSYIYIYIEEGCFAE
jgi:hypothetical protein